MRLLFVRSFIIAALMSGFAVCAQTPAAAQLSTMEVHRMRAAALFDRRFDALAMMRTALADDRMKYERACRGKATTGRGIGLAFLRADLVWFVQTLQIDNERRPSAACSQRG